MSFDANVDRQYVELTSPKAGKVFSRNIVVAGELIKTPDAWKGRIINFVCLGNSAFLVTGLDNALLANTADVSAYDGTSKVMTADVNTPFPLPTSVIVPFYFDSADEYFFIIGATATGRWYASAASPTKGGHRP